MTTTPAEDFSDWLGHQFPPDPATAEPLAVEAAASGSPRPDYSQAGKGEPAPLTAANAFEHLIRNTL